MNNSYQNYSMDDIIFENRNKSYGAYQLRRITDKNAAYGLLVTTSAIVVFILIAMLMPPTNSSIIPHITKVEPVNVLVDVPEPMLPKIITHPKSIAPPANTQTFVELTPVVETPAITSEPVKQIDLANSTAAISTETNNISNTTAGNILTTNTNTGTDIGTTIETPVKTKPVTWAEVMPSFVGGNEALIKYLKSHISMDTRDIEMGLSGKVLIQFYVDIDGSIKDAKVIKDNVGGRCAERALAVINNMPKWNPGRQGDKPVKVYHTLPITFQVN